ncbi:unnamed protein product [Allacma fusca]|uniref:Uncharacterized protein n=1 Tax=Allacma fusca TaxID=39272 RepID=A0A8J2J0Y6_9HEXA|nr:unnamed protein product [Allacma fusca]
MVVPTRTILATLVIVTLTKSISSATTNENNVLVGCKNDTCVPEWVKDSIGEISMPRHNHTDDESIHHVHSLTEPSSSREESFRRVRRGLGTRIKNRINNSGGKREFAKDVVRKSVDKRGGKKEVAKRVGKGLAKGGVGILFG